MRFVIDPDVRAFFLGGLVQALFGTVLWAALRYSGCPAPGSLSQPAFCFSDAWRNVGLIGGFIGGAVAGYLGDEASTGNGLVLGFVSALLGGMFGAFIVATSVAMTEGLALSKAANIEGLWLLVGYSIFVTQILPMIQMGIFTSPLGGIAGVYWKQLGRGR